MVPETADPNGTWKDCKLHISQCSPTQLKVLQGEQIETRTLTRSKIDRSVCLHIAEYRGNFLNALKALDELRSMGMFINSCFIHGQTRLQEAWFGAHSPTLNNTVGLLEHFVTEMNFSSFDLPLLIVILFGQRIATAIADWFYDRRGFVWIDCPYPCDSTCLNL